tara:strand:- start:13662 stop:15449 length:1788 start_codon:yes stop_codon:yes gene_type:complete
MLDLDRLSGMYSAWRARYTDRDTRMETIDRVVQGDFDIFDPDEESVDSKSPNLIQVALEDTAESASLVPTVRVQADKMSKSAKATAQRMEQVAVGYLGANKIDLLIPRSVMDKGAYGMSVWTVTPDFEQRIPLIERRDPKHCYPEPGYRPGDSVNKCIFAREVFYTQLPDGYQEQIRTAVAGATELSDPDENTRVVLIEYFDADEYILAALYQASTSGLVRYQSGSDVPYPVLLDRIENKTGVCPVVIGARISLDGEVRGQFDQVIGLLEAHIRLMGLILDYADQAVYSDIWVRDLIGEMPYGGGSFIELGPSGAIGRVPPAVSSLNVQADMAQLIDGIHVGGRWPKSRPGEIDQSIASAKFLESAAGMMNTAIRTYHQILQRQLEQALRIAFEVDKAYFPGSKSSAGILRNQEFLLDYDPKVDINTDYQVRVEYGLGLGRDPAQSAVLHIQYAQADFISKEFVQENIDGLTDVGRERARLDLEKFRAMALAKLLQGLEAGTIPEAALVDIARAREKGDDLFDLYEEHISKPAQEMQDMLLGTGLGSVPPGPPPSPEGPAGPTPVPPAPPGGAELLARLGTEAGPGGTLGTQVQG